MKCPCHSGKSYEECCERFHKGELPEKASELMRSRYSGYALKLIEYIIDTTHPSNPHYKQDELNWRRELTDFCDNTEFEGLEIEEEKEKGDKATVKFYAKLSSGKHDLSFQEISKFVRENGKWYYLSGEVTR